MNKNGWIKMTVVEEKKGLGRVFVNRCYPYKLKKYVLSILERCHSHCHFEG